MSHRSCTIKSPNQRLARENGAEVLGVTEDSVEVQRTGPGTFHIEVVDAPFLLELALENENRHAVVKRAMGHVGEHPPLSESVLRSRLRELGVVFGVLDGAIRDVVEGVYASGPQRDVPVAAARLPVAGAPDAIALRAVPGSTIRDGELVAECDLERLGESGRDVLGQDLPAPGASALRAGEGLELEDGGARWVARVPGCGTLRRDADSLLSVAPAVTMDADRLVARLELHGARGLGPRLSFEEVFRAVTAAGVRHGIDEQALASVWARYEAEMDVPPSPIAHGEAPAKGPDAEFVPEDLAAALARGPKAHQEGRVDHREVHRFHGVRAGELAGIWYPPGAGEDGLGVDGSVIPASSGNGSPPIAGEGLAAHGREDGAMDYVASIDGVLVFEDGCISAKELLVIRGDVEYDTGNIDVDGSLHVQGRILSGFRVTVGHDLVVDLAVEDAVVEVGGSLRVRHGILGGESGSVRVAGDLTTGFAQNATIRCGGDVEIRESDTNSDIRCEGRLTAIEGRGSLRSGHYIAAKGLEALELGSEGSAPTDVRVGAEPKLLDELTEIANQLEMLRAAKAAAQTEYARLHGSKGRKGMDRDRAADIRAFMIAKDARRRLRNKLIARRSRIRTEIHTGDAPEVTVYHRVHQNVTIRILDAVLVCDGFDGGVRFRYDAEESRILMLPLAGASLAA